MYTFDDQTVSDLHKDARGFRPHAAFMEGWAQSDDDNKQAIWDGLIRELDIVQAEEAHAAEVAIADFEATVGETIEAGAGDRENALRWMAMEETFYGKQDVERWVYDHGFLFTSHGRAVVEELMDIVVIGV